MKLRWMMKLNGLNGMNWQDVRSLVPPLLSIIPFHCVCGYCLSTDCYRVDNNKAVRWWLQPAKRSARYAASRGAVIIRGCLLHLRLIGCSSLLRCVARKRLADRCIRHVTDSACAICKTCSIPTAGCWWSAGQSCDWCSFAPSQSEAADERVPPSTG